MYTRTNLVGWTVLEALSRGGSLGARVDPPVDVMPQVDVGLRGEDCARVEDDWGVGLRSESGVEGRSGRMVVVIAVGRSQALRGVCSAMV